MIVQDFESLFAAHVPRRIAIIKPSALGDVVQALPLLPVLRRRFPGSHMAWVIQRELRDLVSDHPCLDQVIAVDRRPTWQTATGTLWELRRGNFDTVFDLQGLLRSAVLTVATGARWRIGLETAREGAAYTTNVTLSNTGRDIAAHARYWRIAEGLGVGHLPREAWINVSATALDRARQWLSPLSGPIFAVQWGAKWQTKRWPISGFVTVLQKALRQWGGSVVIVGGKGEAAECADLAKQLSGAGPVLDLAGRTSLKELAAVLSRCDFVVSNDSGPLHLAAELGVPTLGIFTCTSPVRSGPPGDRHEQVATELSCAASYRKVCPHSGSQHQACHAELTAERVWERLRRLVEKHRPVELRERIAA